jgi:hypothetical protein
MKLKVKLASEHCSNLKSFNNLPVGPTYAYRMGYLDGFEKARALAAAETTRFNYDDDPGLLDAQVRITEIGEEEVSE